MRTGVAAAVIALLSPGPLGAQATTMPSSLRYGSGLMDIPVASVLPHLAITGTMSGFFLELGRTVEVNDSGDPAGFGGPVDAFYEDASFAMGLFDRAEIGTTLQSLGGRSSGGDVWGLFGRVRLLRPAGQGVGLAAGARWVAAPDFGDGGDVQPNRLGIPDPRFRSYPGKEGVGTGLSLYGVASAQVRGSQGGLLPPYDLTFALGYGNGMFADDGGLGFYASSTSGGWFLGSAIHVGLGGRSILTLMGEYDGFDVNVGSQLDVGGIRVGVQLLAVNNGEPPGGYVSEYRKPRLGLLASVALCPGGGGPLCRPHLMERPTRAVLQLPAPPPDTVVVTREVAPPLPDGTPALVCLATGDNVRVRVTALGDTLVGPGRVPIGALRPAVAFAGTYARGRGWFERGEAVVFGRGRYARSGKEMRLDCASIARVGEHEGIPVFGPRDAAPPFATLYIPVRPGLWAEYLRDPGPG